MITFKQFLFESQTEKSIADVDKLSGKPILLRGKVRDEWNGEFPLYLKGRDVTSWEGCPRRINGFLNANNSKFKSWENAPEWADSVFLNLSNIKSLNGIPQSKSYSLTDGKIKNLVGLPDKLEYLSIFSFDGLESMKGANTIEANLRISFCPNLNFGDHLELVVGGNVTINKCARITNLKDIHKTFKRIDGSLSFIETPVKSHALGILKIEGLKSVFVDSSESKFEKAIEIISKYVGSKGDILDCQSDLIDADLEEYAQL